MRPTFDDSTGRWTPERFTEYRVMPGPMFSGKWQVESRERFYSPRRGGWDASPWSCVDDRLYATETEARNALPRGEEGR